MFKSFLISILSLFILLFSSTFVMAQDSDEVFNRNVFLLIFNPQLSSGDIIEKYNWNDPVKISNDVISFFDRVSDSRLKFKIVKKQIVNDFNKLEDGYKYNESEFHECLLDSEKCHQPQMADYIDIVVKYNICGMLNSGEINEVWMWGGPYFGYYESTLVGKNPYFYNSEGFDYDKCKKLIPIMGFNYERGLSEALEDFGHRTESTMIKVYGDWNMNNPVTIWDYFSSNFGNTTLSKRINSFGCGNVHFPANGDKDYDWSNKTYVNTFCDEYLYKINPDTKAFKRINCEAWGCNSLGYFEYWYSHIPSFIGNDSKGVNYDWWKYISDPNNALVKACIPSCSIDSMCGDTNGCGGKCTGKCENMAEASCISPNVLRTVSEGKCSSDFKCNSDYQDITCEFGCKEGVCLSESNVDEPTVSNPTDTPQKQSSSNYILAVLSYSILCIANVITTFYIGFKVYRLFKPTSSSL